MAIGIQDFEKMIANKCFYVDKTDFIREWWSSGDKVTLIARPRPFGKTLNMSMLDYFFSVQHTDRGNLFEGLAIWNHEEYRQLQGTYPVINSAFKTNPWLERAVMTGITRVSWSAGSVTRKRL